MLKLSGSLSTTMSLCEDKKFGCKFDIFFCDRNQENIHYCRTEKGNYKLSTYEKYNGGCDDHDHCEICSTVISCKLPDRELYSSPRNIVCAECYEDFIKVDDYLDKIQTYEKFERPIKGKTNGKTWLNQIKNMLTIKKIKNR